MTDDDAIEALALRVAASKPLCDVCDKPATGRLYIAIEHGPSGVYWVTCSRCHDAQAAAGAEEPQP